MVGDFDYLEAYTSGDFNGEPVLCRLYAPVGLAVHGQYSLDLAVKVSSALLFKLSLLSGLLLCQITRADQQFIPGLVVGRIFLAPL